MVRVAACDPGRSDAEQRFDAPCFLAIPLFNGSGVQCRCNIM